MDDSEFDAEISLAGRSDYRPTGTAAEPVDSPAEESDLDFDDSWEELESPADRTRAIDATLARFSAVHDQIAVEEAARRKKYSWLLGKRSEPELGRDMPFDFVEGRDAGASRMEWKQQERKRRSMRLLMILAIVAVIVGVAVVGVMSFA